MQNLTQVTVNNTSKGLITEAGELTFPEGASVDELNCSLSRDGSRSRRLGLAFEEGYELSSFTMEEDEVFTTGEWANPGGISNLTFMVIQTGSTLYFYNSGQVPYSGQYTGLSIDLSPYQISGGDVTTSPCDYAVISSALVVANPAMETIYVTYDGVSLSVTQIEFRTRDFEWASDICDLNESVTVADVTVGRKYDTLNTGWVGNSGSTSSSAFGGTLPSGTGTAALSTYTTSTSNYPPLTHPWYSGKDSSGNFSVSEWSKIYAGSSLIGNGHYVLDFFNKDRNAATGFTGIPSDVETSRFRTVTVYTGRIFYAGLGAGKNSGKILYSRLVESVVATDSCTPLGECFQQNDPTAEYYSDLLETDGGVIHIPDAYNIKKLYSHNQYLYVFAENGVWVISGPDNTFKPTSYYVAKVSNVGIYSTGSFVSAEGVPFWWSKYGIHTFAYDDSSGFPIEQNMSINTIQTLWDALDTNSKTRVKAAYDRVNKQIFWVYPTNGESRLNKLNRMLILDIPLQAFYPWEVAENDNYVVGLYFFDSYGSESYQEAVTTIDGTPITTSTLEPVTVTRYSLLSASDTRLGALCYSGGNLTIALFSSKDFVDWGTDNYQSYVVTGYNFGGDLLLKKSAPYVTVYCRSTEEGYGPSPDYETINPSGLFMEAYWDFKDYPSSRQQVYRIKPTPTVNTSDLTDSGQSKTVVTSRLKVRGNGRSFKLRFEAEEGKNFILLGYSVLVGANARF